MIRFLQLVCLGILAGIGFLFYQSGMTSVYDFLFYTRPLPGYPLTENVTHGHAFFGAFVLMGFLVLIQGARVKKFKKLYEDVSENFWQERQKNQKGQAQKSDLVDLFERAVRLEPTQQLLLLEQALTVAEGQVSRLENHNGRSRLAEAHQRHESLKRRLIVFADGQTISEIRIGAEKLMESVERTIDEAEGPDMTLDDQVERVDEALRDAEEKLDDVDKAIKKLNEFKPRLDKVQERLQGLTAADTGCWALLKNCEISINTLQARLAEITTDARENDIDDEVGEVERLLQELETEVENLAPEDLRGKLAEFGQRIAVLSTRLGKTEIRAA